MNFDGYRRSMNSEKLPEETKAKLSAYADALPISNSSKFARIRRRKIAKYASLAACFTVICFVGTPFLIASTIRCGSSAPESDREPAATAATEAYCSTGAVADGNYFNILTNGLLDNADDLEAVQTEALPEDYKDIFLSVPPANNETSDEDAKTEHSASSAEGQPHPYMIIECPHAKAYAYQSHVELVYTDEKTGSIVYDKSCLILSIFSWDKYLVVCTQSEGSSEFYVTAYLYDVSSSTEQTQLGIFEVSGALEYVNCADGILEIETSFKPITGDISELETYVPKVICNGNESFIPPENCIITHSGDGNMLCYVVTTLEIDKELSILNLHAEYTEKRPVVNIKP